jgi:hypothetical protein
MSFTSVFDEPPSRFYLRFGPACVNVTLAETAEWAFAAVAASAEDAETAAESADPFLFGYLYT